MGRVEAPGDIGQYLCREVAIGHHGRDLVMLAQVAQVHPALDGDPLGRDALGLQNITGLGLHLVENLVQLGQVQGVEGSPHGAYVVVLEITLQHPEGTEHRRRLGHDHSGNAHDLGDLGAVQRPCATHGDQGKATGIVAFLHADDFGRVSHVGVDQPVDAIGGLYGVDPQRLGNLLANSLLSGFSVDGQLPAEVEVGVDIAKYHVGVGGGWPGAALAVTGRPWVGSG